MHGPGEVLQDGDTVFGVSFPSELAKAAPPLRLECLAVAPKGPDQGTPGELFQVKLPDILADTGVI